MRAAASIVGTEAGFITLSEPRAARVIARYNIPHAFLSTDTTIDDAPFARDERVLIRDASSRADIHALLGRLALTRTGFYLRLPLRVRDGQVFGLTLFGSKEMQDVTERQLALVDELAGSMLDEINRHYPEDAGSLTASMQLTMAEIGRWLDATDLPGAIIDRDMRILRVNETLARLVNLPENIIENRLLSELDLPARDSIAFLFRHALESGLSTPGIDIFLNDGERTYLPPSLRMVGSPITPVDGAPVVVATFDPARIASAANPAAAGLGLGGAEPTVEFLLETLVQRRAIRTRKDVSYVTLRSWRSTIRAHQIKALKAIKRAAPASIAGEIAGEMRDDVRSLFGAGSFRAVVPMPCGHSQPGRCLSEEIAKALARELSLPVAHALSLPRQEGASHPKTNTRRAPMTLLSPVEGPVLLVDDVSTSGQHIEEAAKLLRGSGAGVLSIAWIGGDADSKQADDDDLE